MYRPSIHCIVYNRVAILVPQRLNTYMNSGAELDEFPGQNTDREYTLLLN